MTNYNKRNLNFHKKASKTNSSSIDSKLINKSKINNKSLMLNKNKLFLLKAELNNNNINSNKKNLVNNKKLFNSSSVDNINTKKFQARRKKLPPIKNKNPKNNNHQNNNIIIYNKCNDCYINKIFIYCRTCDKFLCNNCALNKKSYHISHKEDFMTIIQDSNKANIKKYHNIIDTQLKESLSSFNKIGKNIIEENNEEDNKEDDNEKNIENFNYNKVINNISDNIYKLVDKATEMKNSLENIDFSQVQDKTKNQKISDICENEKKILKKLDVFEYVSPFQPFFILNTYERNMAKYFNNYGVNYDERIYIKTQIELLFENVENEVDNALTEIEKIIGNKDILV